MKAGAAFEKSFPFRAPLAYSLPFFSMHINCTILGVCLQLPLANIHSSSNNEIKYSAVQQPYVVEYSARARLRQAALFVFISSPRGVSDLLGSSGEIQTTLQSFPFFLEIFR